MHVGLPLMLFLNVKFEGFCWARQTAGFSIVEVKGKQHLMYKPNCSLPRLASNLYYRVRKASNFTFNQSSPLTNFTLFLSMFLLETFSHVLI